MQGMSMGGGSSKGSGGAKGGSKGSKGGKKGKKFKIPKFKLPVNNYKANSPKRDVMEDMGAMTGLMSKSKTKHPML